MHTSAKFKGRAKKIIAKRFMFFANASFKAPRSANRRVPQCFDPSFLEFKVDRGVLELPNRKLSCKRPE